MASDSTGARPKKQGFVFVAHLEDFKTRSQISVKIMGKPVSVFQKKDTGTFFAKEMACKHQGADLSTLPVKNNEVVCRRHGWKYNVVDGECVNHDSPPLRAHEVAVEEDAVFVSLFPAS